MKWYCIFVLAVWLPLVISLPEPCEQDRSEISDSSSPKYGFNVLEVSDCANSENCFLKKGHDLVVRSWSFIPKSNSSMAELHVLVSSKDENDRQIQMQMPLPDSDLCEMTLFRTKFEAQLNSTSGLWQCNIESSKPYQLPQYKMPIPRLMPFSGAVNITFMILGDEDCLACALIRAKLTE